jgi:hypothetical protein
VHGDRQQVEQNDRPLVSTPADCDPQHDKTAPPPGGIEHACMPSSTQNASSTSN